MHVLNLSRNFTQALLHFLLAFCTGILVRAQNWQVVLQGELINPDSYMRLVRIQEALDKGVWFANIVSRNESGAGTLIYWSHFVDGFIYLVRLPLLVWMPNERALFWAAALLGPILLGLLGMACAWAARPWLSKQWATLVSVAAAISVPLLNYGQLGVATHHLMIVIWVVLSWGFAARAYISPRYFYGLASGIAAGIAIWVSPEATPYGLLGFGGILWLNMLSHGSIDQQESTKVICRQIGRVCAFYGLGFLLAITFAVLVDPPYQGRFSPELDRISITFIVLALLMLVASLVPMLLERQHCSRLAKVLLIPIAGMSGLAVWLYLYPAYLRGLSGLMTSAQASAFFITTEMASINTVELFLYFGFSGVISVIALLAIAHLQRQTRAKLAILYVAFGALVCTAFAFWYARFAIYSAALSVMVLGALLTFLSGQGEDKNLSKRVIVIIVFLLLPASINYVYGSFISPGSSNTTMQNGQNSNLASCNLGDAVKLVTPLNNAVVLTEPNIGPALLYRSKIKIVGSFYHAGIKGYMRQKAAWESTSLEKVPPELVQTQAQYILICASNSGSADKVGETMQNLKKGPSSLHEELEFGRPPNWLLKVSSSSTSDWVLYELKLKN